MKVERSVMSGQAARQAAISSSVFAAAAGRAMPTSDTHDVEVGDDVTLVLLRRAKG